MQTIDLRGNGASGLDLRGSKDTHFIIGSVRPGKSGYGIRIDDSVNCIFEVRGVIGAPTAEWVARGYNSAAWEAHRATVGISGHNTIDCTVKFTKRGRIAGLRNGMSVNGTRLRVEGAPGVWTFEGIWSDFIWTRGTDVSFVNVSGRAKIDLPESPHQNMFQVGKGKSVDRLKLWGCRFELRNYPAGWTPASFTGGGAFILPGEDPHTDLFIGNSRLLDTGAVAFHLSNVQGGQVSGLEITEGTRVAVKSGSAGVTVSGLRYIPAGTKPAWPPAGWDMTEPA